MRRTAESVAGCGVRWPDSEAEGSDVTCWAVGGLSRHDRQWRGVRCSLAASRAGGVWLSLVLPKKASKPLACEGVGDLESVSLAAVAT